jgi:histidinol-phosphate aminotransferase
MMQYINEVQKEKKRIINSINKLGVTVFPSFTNFLLLKTNISNISERLSERDVLVHDCSNQLSSEYIRVTIGSKEENNLFLQALKDVIS